MLDERVVTDTTIIATAVAVALGAWWAAAVPLVVALAVAVTALVWRNPVVLVLGGLLLAAALGARSWAGLHTVEPGPLRGEVTLVTDPEEVLGAVRAEVRDDGHRYDAWARGRAASTLRARSAGEVVVVVGHIEPVEIDPWRASHHLAARLVVDDLTGWSSGDPLSQLANALRHTLLAGARRLPVESRPLFGGFVLGDDRGQTASMADDFRGAGLTHLLVVSGENVAFVLAVASPILARVGLRGRLVATICLLGFFALVTRFEPSVLRATVMAALAATACTLGRPVSTCRLLAMAVIGLLLVDPLLVQSVGFRLSVAACAGIAALARPLADAVPGPRAIARALGVTLSAQLGVAPVLVPLAGGLPIVTVPANLLAEPVAGAVMGWGMTAGLLAGLVPGWLATALHLPTAVGLWWVATVARWAAAAPLGELGPFGLAALGAGAVSVVVARRRGHALTALVLGLAAVIVAVAAPGVPMHAKPGRVELGSGATLWQAPGIDGTWGRVLVLDGRADGARVLAALRRAGADRVDMLVVTSTSPAAVSAAVAVKSRAHIDVLWVPEGSRTAPLAGAVVPEQGLSVAVGGVVVRVVSVAPRLDVDVSTPGVASPGEARAGPRHP